MMLSIAYLLLHYVPYERESTGLWWRGRRAGLPVTRWSARSSARSCSGSVAD
ncbi:hypothetical protein [Frankia sp. CcWB3]